MLLTRMLVTFTLGCMFSVVVASNTDVNDGLAEQAFSSALNTVSPLDKDQIKEVRRAFNAMNKAASFTQDTPPTPVTSALTVDLATGATPPVIRLSAGYISSLVFTDSTGQPWPIKAYDIGNPSAFNISWEQSSDNEHDSMQNTLLIQSMVAYQEGNLAVMLKGLNTPIMFTLIPGQQVVDYRVDIRVPRAGPNAINVGDAMPEHANPVLQDVLNNIAPAHARVLNVTGGQAQAWILGKKMYIRTPLTIVSPAWIATMTGSDGFIKAYELPKASVVLAISHGKMVQLKVEEL